MCVCEWHMPHVAMVTQLLYWLLQLVTFVGYQTMQVVIIMMMMTGTALSHVLIPLIGIHLRLHSSINSIMWVNAVYNVQKELQNRERSVGCVADVLLLLHMTPDPMVVKFWTGNPTLCNVAPKCCVHFMDVTICSPSSKLHPLSQQSKINWATKPLWYSGLYLSHCNYSLGTLQAL